MTVQGVVDGRTVALSDGTKIQIAGLAPPGECWSAAAVSFAKAMLMDKPVRIDQAPGKISPLTLSDGTDYALLVLGQGVARTDTSADLAMREAQTAAQKASLGLWGPPCSGVDTKPTTTTPPPPVVTTTKPAATTTTTTTTTTTKVVYFFNCEEARKAGAAPIRKGKPGYRNGLDRNHNGIACE